MNTDTGYILKDHTWKFVESTNFSAQEFYQRVEDAIHSLGFTNQVNLRRDKMKDGGIMSEKREHLIITVKGTGAAIVIYAGLYCNWFIFSWRLYVDELLYTVSGGVKFFKEFRSYFRVDASHLTEQLVIERAQLVFDEMLEERGERILDFDKPRIERKNVITPQHKDSNK